MGQTVLATTITKLASRPKMYYTSLYVGTAQYYECTVSNYSYYYETQ